MIRGTRTRCEETIILILGVQLCFRRFPIDGLAVSGGRNK